MDKFELLKSDKGYRLRFEYSNDETGESRVETTRFMTEDQVKEKLYFMKKMEVMSLNKKKMEYDDAIENWKKDRMKLELSLESIIGSGGERDAYETDKNLEFIGGDWKVFIDGKEQKDDIKIDDVDVFYGANKKGKVEPGMGSIFIKSIFGKTRKGVELKLTSERVDERRMVFIFVGKLADGKVVKLKRRWN